MSDAYARLAEDLCVALGRDCKASVLAKLLAVFEAIDVEHYRRLVHERFNGLYVVIPATRPPKLGTAEWAQFEQLLREVRRSELSKDDETSL